MSDSHVAVPPAVEPDDDGPSILGLVIALLSVGALVAFWQLDMQVAMYTAAVVVISLVIWQACDPFADAAQWIGTEMQIPGSVRGATLDAIASSMPELFTGIFFVFVAISGMSDLPTQLSGTKGYGDAIATCAGSAVYNMIVIPSVCAIFISIARPSRPTIDVEDEVIRRDGLWFLGCELLLLVFLFQRQLHAWMGFALLGAYVLYVIHLFIDAKRYRRKLPILKETIQDLGTDEDPEVVREAARSRGATASAVLIHKLQDEIAAGEDPEDDDDEPEDAGVFFGFGSIPLSHATAWPIIIVCTAIAAAACYYLVEVTEGFAEAFAVPSFFVAVIVAAAASSVPDTFLSMGSARRGDDDGAVSNAFGSNIFDICICLSIPLLLAVSQNDWQPLTLLTEDGTPVEGLEGLAVLRILLWVFSLITLGVIWHKRQLTRGKAFGLLLLYVAFIGYAIFGARTSREVPEEEAEARTVPPVLLERDAVMTGSPLALPARIVRC